VFLLHLCKNFGARTFFFLHPEDGANQIYREAGYYLQYYTVSLLRIPMSGDIFVALHSVMSNFVVLPVRELCVVTSVTFLVTRCFTLYILYIVCKIKETIH
jgi:hypothetical protein